MSKLINTFHGGRMDKDTDKAFIKPDRYRHAENLRFHTNNGNDGTGVNPKGTTSVSDETGGSTDLKCIGGYFNEDKDVIYYLLASTNGAISKIVEYDIPSGNTTIVADDTTSILKFNKNDYITGINEIDGLLFISEWGNNPRRLNVERAKTYGIDGFTEDDITVIVKPPNQKLKLTLQDTASKKENTVKEIFVSFSYRYRYLDGEYSVLAPFSEFAFHPNKFKYNFAEQSNSSMVNKFNQVLIEFNTGNERVTEIQLIYKESESNTEWIIDDFNKELLGYGHNEAQTFAFDNSKTKRGLSDTIIRSSFDNVPRTSRGQSIIDGRLLYAHYKENYNLLDGLNAKIKIDFSLLEVNLPNTIEVDGEDVPSLVPLRTCKSNRDYEAVLVYEDEFGRITTSLESKENTIFIENSKSVTANSIDVILKNKPPAWAKRYRFYIKQAKKTYDQILPTLFYEDGVYRWIKLEGADKDKIKEGDYLIVKVDSKGIKSTLIKTKVLEVKSQEKNFLQSEDVTDKIVERSGLYFKVKPDGYNIDIDDFVNYLLETYDNSSNSYDNPIRDLAPYISQPHFYGDTLHDLTSSGAFTGAFNSKKRYLIQIKTSAAIDEFRWSDDDGATWFGGGAGTLIPITGLPQSLNDGVIIEFGAITGHSLADEWNINARSTFSINGGSKAYAFFRTVNLHDEPLVDIQDEVIQNGARLFFEYDEYNEGVAYFVLDEISSDKYDNIEEWYHKENIFDKINLQQTINIDQIYFVRGMLYHDDSATQITQDSNSGTITMVIRSVFTQNNDADKRVKIRSKSEIIQTENIILFETEPVEQQKDEFFEIGKTYPIVGGYHISDSNIPTDVDQSLGVDLRVKLDFFNAYSFGNAVESYKIKDEFNKKGLAVGIRTSTSTKEEYKEVTRTVDITWSDVYNDESNFNGLNTFNLSEINFIKLDKENGSIQKIYNDNGNLLVLQEDAIGKLPYNKNIIYDTQGGRVVGISKNILNKESYSPYASGLHGISKNPESFVAIGSRKYFTDRVRGDIIRLSIDGITEINQYGLEHFSSDELNANKGLPMVSTFDPKHQEYLLYSPNSQAVLGFKEKTLGFPNFYTFKPDFMLYANNEVYAWKLGVMYRMNASETRNNFFGVQYQSKIKFYVNQMFGVEKLWKAVGLNSTHAWLLNISTSLTSRQIPKESFVKKEDYWYSEIMGNTNDNTEANSTFGLGTYQIINGEIITSKKASVLSVGDHIISSSLLFAPNKVIGIESDKIVLETDMTTIPSFLMYKKNQNIDGSSIRGDILEIEMISDETEKIELKAVFTEMAKSFN